MKVRDLHWSLHFLVWTAGVTTLGVVMGAAVFPLFGLLADTGKTSGALAVTGMRILGFYFLIWAPGIALVMTVKNAYERRRNRPPADSL